MTRPESHSKHEFRVESSCASPKANSGAARRLTQRWSRAGQRPRRKRTEDVLQASVRGGTPALRGSSVVSRKAIWGETSGNSASKHPGAKETDKKRVMRRVGALLPQAAPPPGTPPGVGGADCSSPEQTAVCSTAVPIADKRGSQSRQRAVIGNTVISSCESV